MSQVLGYHYEAIETHAIVVLTSTENDSFQHTSNCLVRLGIMGYIIIAKTNAWKIYALNVFGRYGTHIALTESSPKFNEHFPDRQKNLEGYVYKVALIEQYPRIRSKKRLDGDYELGGVNIEIFSEIAKHQHASWEIEIMSDYKKGSKGSSKDMEQFSLALVGGSADLTLNTAFNVPTLTYRSLVNTYDTVAYCAVVPVPPRLSFLRFLLTPYDPLSWIALWMAVAASSLLWRFSIAKSGVSNSTSFFVFGVIANFLGQAIPFKKTNRKQNLLLYLCILATFIMGNAYQSIILSLMSKSREGERFKTFDELLQSSLAFETDVNFKSYLETSQKSVDLGRFNTEWARLENFGMWNKSVNAGIFRCDGLEFELNFLVDRQTYDKFYLLPDKQMPMYESFMLSARSPFYPRLQRYYDWLFESGIRQHFDHLLEIKNENLLKSRNLFISNECYLLNLDDLSGIFLLWFAGNMIGLLIFLLERFSYVSKARKFFYWRL